MPGFPWQWVPPLCCGEGMWGHPVHRDCVSGLGTAGRVSHSPELQPCCPVGTAGSSPDVACRESAWPLNEGTCSPLRAGSGHRPSVSVVPSSVCPLQSSGIQAEPVHVLGPQGGSVGSGQGLLVATALWEGREGGREQLCLPVRLIFSCLLKSSVFLHLFV